MLSVVCLRTKGFLTADYVNILFDAVRRNTTIECKYICFTDDPEGLDDYIECRPIPGLNGWWNKLYLFSQELEGQVFYFDLDTVITSNIDDFLDYQGEFATLRDFHRPDGIGSGLMSWHGNLGIWEKFKESGFKEIDGGDQAFIENCDLGPERIQDLFSGVYSYKQSDCERWPPADAKIICFHGKPRPHEVRGSWVPLVWRKGGAKEISRNNDFMNISQDQVIKNMTENCKRELPWFIPSPVNNKTLCIVGGSPSLKKNLTKLRNYISLGADVISLNGSLKYLLSIGITPDYHCQFDARPENAGFLDNAPEGIKYLIGSMSHPSVFEKLEGKDVTLWHGGFDMDEQQKVLEPYQDKPIVIIGGGSTVGLRAFHIGHFLGYKKFAAFGMDSSFSGEKHHAYSQPLNDKDGRFDVWMLGKRYECAPWMYRQAIEFQDAFRKLQKQGCLIKVVGEGIIPDMCNHFNKEKV